MEKKQHNIITINCLQSLHDLTIGNESVVLDLRNFNHESFGKEVVKKLTNLDDKKVKNVIISNRSCFFEILSRLKEQKIVYMHKLSIQSVDVPIDHALLISKLIYKSYDVLEQLHTLHECHPGLFAKLDARIKQLKLAKKKLTNLKIIEKAGTNKATYQTSKRENRHSAIRKYKKLQNLSPQHQSDTLKEKNESKEDGNNNFISSPTSQAKTVPTDIGANTTNTVNILKCYMCKEMHTYSPKLCHPCSSYTLSMLESHTDLKGRYALVTGARIKIGLEVAHRLLQDGCHVIVTTRFPNIARETYKQFSDFDVWKDRVQFKKLDLQEMSSIESFIEWIQKKIPHLDILINNAAQTIWRPKNFYDGLQKLELEYDKQTEIEQISESRSTTSAVDDYEPDKKKLKLDLQISSSLPILSHYKENELFPSVNHSNKLWFPEGLKADDGQQLDLRPMNSWRVGVTEVPLSELLQCLAINSVAPFILISRLKSLILKSPFERKFVVNVSAMEGQFSRVTKGPHHPHTNMAKAALNMLTRTTGMEFQSDGIYMTSVDTGWCTDERPHGQLQHEKAKGFILPLTPAEGAARVYHPIVHGLNKQNAPYFSVFLKDFEIHPW